MTEQERQVQDAENARMREEIAARQEAAYVACLKHCINCFGPGWMPSHRHDLIEKDEAARVRHTPEHPRVSATVYSAKGVEGGRRHFVLDGQGVPREVASMEAGFGALLLEPHPTKRIEVRGELVPIHRYDLCWRPYELYKPKSAEQLATLRASRAAKKQARERTRWVEENPLLAFAGLVPEELEAQG